MTQDTQQTLTGEPWLEAGGSERARRPIVMGLAMAGAGWAVLWSMEGFWNPLAFTVMWTGAALAMWGASRDGYPSVRRHIALAAVSVPVWWWYELVNTRVMNWEYVNRFEYTAAGYAALSSVAFATVVPALVAASALIGLQARGAETTADAVSSRRNAYWALGLGAALQLGVIALPTYLYPLVWVAPFLVIDSLVSLAGGHSLVADLVERRLRESAVIAAAGLTCGLLWEFWNFWATPKWVYHIPLLNFGRVFEMPILGYGGYVPFAWSMIQLVRLVDILWRRIGPRGRTRSL